MSRSPLSIHKFGYNPDAAAGVVSDIWTGVVPYNWLTVSQALRIRAGGDVADDVAGLGAQKIELLTLDDDFNQITEELVTAGAAASAPTPGIRRRLLGARVLDVGVYGGSNVGPIAIETTSGLLVGNVAVGLGQSQMSMYTVPKGHIAYIDRAEVNVAGGKTGDVILHVRNNAEDIDAPFTAKRMAMCWPNVGGQQSTHLSIPVPVPALTDIWFSVVAAGNNTPCAINYDLDIYKAGD